VVAREGSQLGAMAAHRSWVARRLRCSICYKVSSYGFRMTCGTCFTILGQRRRATPSGRWRCSSLRLDRQQGTPPAPLRLQELDGKLADVHRLLLGRFNGSKWQWKNKFGGYLWFSAFFNLWVKIRAQLASIYRGFGTYA
jgi:hypothetical protein